MAIVDLDRPPRPADRPRRRMPSRSAVLFVLGLLTLLLVTGSARPVPHFPGELWSTAYDEDNDTVTLTPTSLYLFHRRGGVPALTAYDLATGATRWSVPAPEVLAQVPSVTGGVIVVPDGFERYFNRPDLVLARTTRTVARDVRTGAALWRAAGAPADVTDRSVLLVDADPGGVAELHNLGLRDGRTLWSRPVPGLSSVAVLGDAVVTATADGRLTVLRYGDGTLARTGKVSWPGDGRLSAAAGRLVVTGQATAGRTSIVVRPDTLAELWRSDGALTDCGAVLCGTDPGGLLGRDPDTGVVRWRQAAMTTAAPVGTDRIAVSSELNGLFQLLDPATGRRVGAAGTGVGSWGADGRSAVDGVTAPPSSFVPSGVTAPPSSFVLRGVTRPPGQTAVVGLDLRTGDQQALGAVGGTGWTGCRNVTRYLVCRQATRVAVIAVE